ncbi:hypothetical protein B0H12DRAFT_1071467 [Mycena haematopus]|nr:hypothetical protein B0H12DRAFT_1071467 [Mycena haematopus]
MKLLLRKAYSKWYQDLDNLQANFMRTWTVVDSGPKQESIFLFLENRIRIPSTRCVENPSGTTASEGIGDALALTRICANGWLRDPRICPNGEGTNKLDYTSYVPGPVEPTQKGGGPDETSIQLLKKSSVLLALLGLHFGLELRLLSPPRKSEDTGNAG